MKKPSSKLWKDIARLDLSKIEESSWLIENFLAARSTQLCYGAFGTSKTTALLKAAWCVSQGIPFLGMQTKQRAVLYLDYENPADVLKGYCKGLSIDPSSPWLTIWDRAAEHRVPLPGSERLQRFIQRCKKITGNYPWIIFDSWTSLLKDDENQQDSHPLRCWSGLYDCGPHAQSQEKQQHSRRLLRKDDADGYEPQL
jgi:RecA-family ATPase